MSSPQAQTLLFASLMPRDVILGWETKRMTPAQRAKYRETYLSKKPDQEALSSRNYRKANKEKVAAYQRAYAASPRGKVIRALTEAKRRARKRNAAGECSLSQWEARKAMWGGECWLKLAGCTKAGTTIDHVIPLSKGGTNWPSNLRPACPSCNGRKFNKRVV